MKNRVNKTYPRVKYSIEPIKAKIIRDLLPNPDTLIFKKEKQEL